MFDNYESNEENTRKVSAEVGEHGQGGREKGEGRTAAGPDRRLSDAAREFLATIADPDEARSPATINEYRYVVWSVFEFLGCDPPLRELTADLANQYVAWLKRTPVAPRCCKLPRHVTAATVSAFFAWPPLRRKSTGRPPAAQTVKKKLTHAAPFFKFLGRPPKLKKRERPSSFAPLVRVPKRSQVVAWWREYLDGSGPASPGHRRAVVMFQGALLLTGARLFDALGAKLEDCEGNWCLLRTTKTRRPRIIYVPSQAMGIARALRDRWLPKELFSTRGSTPLLGWTQTENSWHASVRDCGDAPHAPPKPQQAMRCILSNYFYRKKEYMAEAAQLGHGGWEKGVFGATSQVVFRHYLDVLRPLPKLLEPLKLPEIEGFQWPEPLLISRAEPVRLYDEYRRIVSEM